MLVDPVDLLGYRFVLLLLGQIDRIGKLDPLQTSVRRNLNDPEIVDLAELLRFGHRSSSHPRELLVKLEKILKGDRR